MKALTLYIKNEQKTVKLPTGLRMLVRRCCNAVLSYEKFGQPAEVSVIFVDNTTIRGLNATYRGKDIETDVLSFPLGNDGVYDTNPETGAKLLGDIVISVERALAQAEEFDHPFTREIGFLTVHSMLHLLGYDHMENKEAIVMHDKERDILASLELSRNKAFDAEDLMK
ncbi:MAG: rRNA maturation RNase YbeY [Clostridia bacterium]|nr:rRNA maturation RNase YbeY [Clostridia bacterium]